MPATAATNEEEEKMEKKEEKSFFSLTNLFHSPEPPPSISTPFSRILGSKWRENSYAHDEQPLASICARLMEIRVYTRAILARGETHDKTRLFSIKEEFEDGKKCDEEEDISHFFLSQKFKEIRFFDRFCLAEK